MIEIARRRGVKIIAKGKSMISEEIELNHALEAAGLTPVETDLGEWIVQLAGERPSHILAPVIHRSRGQIAEVLATHRGGPMSDDPQALVTYSREQLRATFLEAGMGITGANFMVAESGTVIVLENEGNGRLVSSLPRCHVVLAGLERVLETTADAAFMVEQLSLAAVGRELPSYVSWLSGPATDGDDGPEEFIVIVLDNGRSRIRESDEREILNCIRCGACQTVCPVYSKVGGHAYGSVYGGPIGAVLTPLLTDMQARRGPQAAVPLVALRRLHRHVPGRHPAARPARARSRARQPRRRSPRAASAPPGAPGRAPGRARGSTAPRRAPERTPARSRAPSGPARAGSTAARRCRCRARKPFHRRWQRPGGRRVIDEFIAAVQADGGQAARVPTSTPPARTSPGCSAATRRSASGTAIRSCWRSTPPRSAASRRRPRPSPASRARPSASPPTGTLVLTYGEGRSRATGLLPDLARRRAHGRPVLPTLDEAIARVYAGEVPRAMTLVTGASATSDIEKIRVTGAHGPRRVAVVVIG